MGLKPMKKPIQISGINEDLRIGLWNLVFQHYVPSSDWYRERSPKRRLIVAAAQNLWNIPVDELPSHDDDLRAFLKNHIYESDWNIVFEFIEFLPSNYGIDLTNKEFIENCNRVLERESSAFRFVSGRITQVTSKLEIGEVEQAIASPLQTVNTHLESALQHLSDKKNPNYRNSIKESISAVEALCKKITGKKKATLGDALDQIAENSNIKLAQSFRQGLDKIYGYSSSSDGIRHALSDESNLKYEDAKFMLVLCSAFINYLISKTDAAGINLT
jgi:hypothetical protein